MNGATASLATTEIRFADGRAFHLATPGAPGGLFLHPIVLKFLLLCALVYGLLDGDALRAGSLAGDAAPLLWSALALAALVWYGLITALLRILRRHGGLQVVYTPFVTVSLLLVLSLAFHLVAHLSQGTMPAPDWSADMARHIVLLLIVDVAFSQFVAPLHPLLRPAAAETARPAPPAATAPAPSPPQPQPQPAPPAPAVAEDAAPDAAPDPAPLVAPEPAEIGRVRIGNETFAAEDLHYIRSEDHYLRIVTGRRRMLTRGRLTDAIAQLDIRQGIQVNRSTWIAFAAIQDVQDDGRGNLSLLLLDGESERVAQSRRIAFLAAMNLHRQG